MTWKCPPPIFLPQTSMTVSSGLTYTDGNSRNQGVFVNALTFLPLGDAYDADGNINYEYCKDGGKVNPMADEAKDQYVNNTRSTYFTGNAYLELTPLKGLTFKSVLGTTLSNSRNGVFFGEKSIANITSGYQAPLAEIYNSASYAYRWENVITYNFTLARDHNFGVTGITSWSKNQDEANLGLKKKKKSYIGMMCICGIVFTWKGGFHLLLLCYLWLTNFSLLKLNFVNIKKKII